MPRAPLLALAPLAVGVALPFLTGFNPYLVGVGAEFLIFAIVAVSLDLLMGRSGQISLGHSGFFAVGAYTTAILIERTHLDLAFGLAAAAVLTAISSSIVGFPAERLRGHYLGIVTLGFGVAIAQIALKWSALTNGDEGVHLDTVRLLGFDVGAPVRMYYLALAVLLLTALFSYNLAHSRLGRSFAAVRDSEVAASAMGIPVARTKVLAFAISAAMTGIAGGLFASLNAFVAPEDFGITQTLLFFAMVIVGGLDSIGGAIGGAFVVEVVSQLAAATNGLSLFIVGTTIVAVALFFPAGLKGVFARFVPAAKR
jgi:branched-chain amino acid transport system permease protein